MESCIFCKIARGEIPSEKVYEDERVLAFYDAAPQAPVHVLVIPKAHVENILEADDSMPDDMLSHLMRTATRVARQLGLDKTGFRIVTNCGGDGRQSVFHLHIHVIGGAPLSQAMA